MPEVTSNNYETYLFQIQRKMKREEIYCLKILPFSLYNRGMTMQQILDNAIVQALDYAARIASENKSRTIYVHAVVAVALCWNLYKTVQFKHK